LTSHKDLVTSIELTSHENRQDINFEPGPARPWQQLDSNQNARVKQPIHHDWMQQTGKFQRTGLDATNLKSSKNLTGREDRKISRTCSKTPGRKLRVVSTLYSSEDSHIIIKGLFTKPLSSFKTIAITAWKQLSNSF
jgi:hypothetical protein